MDNEVASPHGYCADRVFAVGLESYDPLGCGAATTMPSFDAYMPHPVRPFLNGDNYHAP